MTDLQKVLSVIVAIVGLATGAVKYVSDQRAQATEAALFRAKVTTICHRNLQLESLFLKYYPAETASLYYPGAPTVCP